MGVPAQSLRFRMALEIESGVECGVGLDTEILFCTRRNPSLLSIGWDKGDVRVEGTMSLEDLEYLVDAEDCKYEYPWFLLHSSFHFYVR